MSQQTFAPNQKYLYKMFLSFTLIALLIFIVGSAFIAFPVSFDKPRAGLVIMALSTAGAFIFWVIAMLLTVPYFKSLEYEVMDDEVIVRVGILTHSVKHVPYRTVTNISVKRDIFDRWFFNLGTLEIQTAGMSGQNGAEEKLWGLENVQDVYELVATELRRYRGAMSPTAAEEQGKAELPGTNTSAELLDEVRQIRRLLAEQATQDR